MKTIIVTRTWRCASRVARAYGLTPAQWVAWTPQQSAEYKLRGAEDPRVIIADCGRLNADEISLIESRYRTPGKGVERARCM